MSILPDLNAQINTVIDTTAQAAALPMFKEYAWDFDNNDFLLNDGKTQIVEGLEALKVWIWKALKTPRYRYLAYTWNYGQELENLVGQELTPSVAQSEGKRYLEEALTINPYITGIKDVSFTQEGAKFNADFTVVTIYGEVSMNV